MAPRAHEPRTSQPGGAAATHRIDRPWSTKSGRETHERTDVLAAAATRRSTAATSGAPAQQVQGPAIALMVVAGLGILGQILGLLSRFIFTGAAMLPNMDNNEAAARYARLMMGGVGIVIGVVGLVVYGFVLWAAMQMKMLRKWNLSVAASVAAMLPCTCCCIFGLPIGIWSLVVLMKPEVKSAFVG